MTKKEEQALREELARCRGRALEIVTLLNPREGEALRYLRTVKGPARGKDIAAAIGKRQTHVVTELSAAIKAGHAKRVGIGEYEAVAP